MCYAQVVIRDTNHCDTMSHELHCFIIVCLYGPNAVFIMTFLLRHCLGLCMCMCVQCTHVWETLFWMQVLCMKLPEAQKTGR